MTTELWGPVARALVQPATKLVEILGMDAATAASAAAALLNNPHPLVPSAAAV